MGQFGRRRFFVASAALLAAPRAARSGSRARLHRIGVLCVLPNPAGIETVQGWVFGALRRAGYVSGKNIEVEWPVVTSLDGPLDAAAADLVRKKVDLILALSNYEILAARRATGTTPIVMWAGVFPQELGLVRSLAHPGGNVTGAEWQGPETAAKILQILKEAKPAARRIALLFNPGFAANPIAAATVDRAAPSLGVVLQHFHATRADEIPAALERIAAQRPDALYVFPDPAVITGKLVAPFAVRHRLVSIGTNNFYTSRWGGLFSYAPDLDDLLGPAVAYVDRILRGARPADLPVERPTRLVFVVNMKTARAIGYTVPQSLLLRADRVIE